MDLLRLYRKLGIPCSMEEAGVYFTLEEVQQIAVKVCSDTRVGNLSFPIDEVMFQKAFLEVNSISKNLFAQKEQV